MADYATAQSAAKKAGENSFTYGGSRYLTQPIRRNPVTPGNQQHFADGGTVRPQARPQYDFWGLINETAEALQVPPHELATLISYETRGSMDPRKAGPTTQWGQHRGLIQFGEPQAKQYGVDFSSPESAMMSQLGKDGAIVKYALGHGFQPGKHNPLQLYATINAGNPNKTGATDENNGGAPGTVADKYYNQMNAHRAKIAEGYGKSIGDYDWMPGVRESGYKEYDRTGTPFNPEAFEQQRLAAEAAQLRKQESLAGFGQAIGDVIGGGSSRRTIDPVYSQVSDVPMLGIPEDQ